MFPIVVIVNVTYSSKVNEVQWMPAKCKIFIDSDISSDNLFCINFKANASNSKKMLKHWKGKDVNICEIFHLTNCVWLNHLFFYFSVYRSIDK